MWREAAKKSDIGEGKSQLVEFDGKVIALFNHKGKFYAVDNKCPHRGGPLVQGHVEDGKVTCPWHAWQFELKTGACDTMPGTQQKCYPVKVEKDEVWIESSS